MFPILKPHPTSLPIPFLWVVPVHQPRASSIMHRTWTGDSFHIWYYTCFNAILPNHPTLSLSHRVQKTVLYICVSGPFNLALGGFLAAPPLMSSCWKWNSGLVVEAGVSPIRNRRQGPPCLEAPLALLGFHTQEESPRPCSRAVWGLLGIAGTPTTTKVILLGNRITWEDDLKIISLNYFS